MKITQLSKKCAIICIVFISLISLISFTSAYSFILPAMTHVYCEEGNSGSLCLSETIVNGWMLKNCINVVENQTSFSSDCISKIQSSLIILEENKQTKLLEEILNKLKEKKISMIRPAYPSSKF